VDSITPPRSAPVQWIRAPDTADRLRTCPNNSADKMYQYYVRWDSKNF